MPPDFDAHPAFWKPAPITPIGEVTRYVSGMPPGGVGGAVTVLFTPWGTPGARLVASENAVLRSEIAEVEARFRVLEDTLS